jgi:hypothetical protein
MIDTFAKAFLTQPPVVFGRRLRAFSLGHSFALDCIGCPVAAGKPYSVQDAALFVAVCSGTAEEAFALLSGGEENERKMQEFGAACVGMDFQAEILKLEEYKRDADAVPTIWQDDGPRSSIGTPWQLAIMDRLRGESALTPEVESALWNMPQAKAICYAAARNENNGRISIVSEEEQEGLRVLRELEEANATG